MTVSVAPLRRRPLALAASLAVMGALGLSAPAADAAEDNLPLFLTLSQSVTRDSNMLKVEDNEQADTLSSTAVRVGLNKAYGRQNYRLDLTASHNKYSTFDQFNYNGFVGSGEFVTDVGSNLRLTANAAASETLPKFEDSRANRTGRNTQTTKRAALDLRYGLYGRMSVNAGYNRSDIKYRLTDFDNRKSNTWSFGARYQPHDLMNYGLTYSETDSELPDGRVTPEEIHRRNLSVVANWRVTGFSVLSGSLGYSRERYEVDPARNFNGVTGSAAWAFTPAGKVSYRVNWLRDTNNQGGYSITGQLASQTGSANRLTNQYSASATWQATAKIAATAQLTHIRYDEESRTTTTVLGQETTDSDNRAGRLNAISLGVDYQPIRSVNLGCDLQHYDRTASVFSRAYSGRALSCSLGFTLD
ncbi:hypothetical protein GTZ97_16210 [Aquabacterium fontiphilum]|jgi:hypothetical protein|uniref:hypothetical protein n=1 Tax=Aquabacterium fontiphilum TaxID=450365 RepID=UPI001378CDA7|nr:hypothetical protein [Aquabacterium fontiphilum]NBD22204.1 hypothetical protein [Aquabacterium fontiphilum]